MVPRKIPVHVKEHSFYDAIPLWTHPGNEGKIKVSLRGYNQVFFGELSLFIFSLIIITTKKPTILPKRSAQCKGSVAQT